MHDRSEELVGLRAPANCPVPPADVKKQLSQQLNYARGFRDGVGFAKHMLERWVEAGDADMDAMQRILDSVRDVHRLHFQRAEEHARMLDQLGAGSGE